MKIITILRAGRVTLLDIRISALTQLIVVLWVTCRRLKPDLTHEMTWNTEWCQFAIRCNKMSVEKRILICINITGNFYSVQNVARSIFCDCILLKCAQSSSSNEICSTWLFIFKRKRSRKIDRTTFYTEWKSALMATFSRISLSIESDL